MIGFGFRPRIAGGPAANFLPRQTAVVPSTVNCQGSSRISRFCPRREHRGYFWRFAAGEILAGRISKGIKEGSQPRRCHMVQRTVIRGNPKTTPVECAAAPKGLVNRVLCKIHSQCSLPEIQRSFLPFQSWFLVVGRILENHLLKRLGLPGQGSRQIHGCPSGNSFSLKLMRTRSVIGVTSTLC